MERDAAGRVYDDVWGWESEEQRCWRLTGAPPPREKAPSIHERWAQDGERGGKGQGKRPRGSGRPGGRGRPKYDIDIGKRPATRRGRARGKFVGSGGGQRGARSQSVARGKSGRGLAKGASGARGKSGRGRAKGGLSYID